MGGEVAPGPTEGAALVMTFVGRSACAHHQEDVCLKVRVDNSGDLGSGWCELRIATAKTGVEEILGQERIEIENLEPGERLTAFVRLNESAVARLRTDSDVSSGHIASRALGFELPAPAP